MNAVAIAIATLAIGTFAQLPWEPCLGLNSQQCIGYDFSTFSAGDFDTVGPGVWSRTTSGTLKVSAPASGSGTTCDRTGGSALTLKAGASLPLKRTARARVRVSGGDGSIGFMFRRSNADNYGLMVAFTDSSCAGNTGNVAGVGRVSAFNHIKPAFVMGLPGITVLRDNWYILSVELVGELMRWRLQTENWMTGGGGAFFSDSIFGLLETSAGTTGGGFGLYCSPGATCEFDDVIFYDTAVHANLTGHLYCHYCTGLVWPVGSADWCRCCQYSCGSANDDSRRSCTQSQGFCTQANRCQSTYDLDRGYPQTYCTPQVITSANLQTTTTTTTTTTIPTTTTSTTTTTTTTTTRPTTTTTTTTTTRPTTTTTTSPPTTTSTTMRPTTTTTSTTTTQLPTTTTTTTTTTARPTTTTTLPTTTTTTLPSTTTTTLPSTLPTTTTTLPTTTTTSPTTTTALPTTTTTTLSTTTGNSTTSSSTPSITNNSIVSDTTTASNDETSTTTADVSESTTADTESDTTDTGSESFVDIVVNDVSKLMLANAATVVAVLIVSM